MLDALIAAWLAANARNLPEVLRYCEKLGIHTGHGEYNKPELAALSEKLGFDWRKIDDGVWVNSSSSKPLTEEEKLQEIAYAKRDNRALQSDT